jgi:AcrR family transcriptional regulator
MPRNRQDRTREEKSSEIVAIAKRLFLEKGYDATTMASIAAEVGIATNVVHWYFATKDELFVAALDSLQSEDLEEAIERFSRSVPDQEEEDLSATLTDFVWRRRDRYGLIATVHERSHCSPMVAEFHERAHRGYREHLDRAVERFSTPVGERKLVVDALITAVEGLVMHRASKREARRMMTFLAKRLVAPSPDAPQNRKEPAG